MIVIVEKLSRSTYPIARVIVEAEEPDFDLPWLRVRKERIAIAVVIGPRRLITIASAVTHAVVPSHRGTTANVIAIDHDRDLALLETNESLVEAWGVEPIEVGMVPSEGDALDTLGVETGLGSAVVAAIGLVRYAHTQRHLLALTIDGRQPLTALCDAAFRGDRLVGLVMQRAPDDAHRADLIPAPMIRAFLEGAGSGAPLGVPALGIAVQSLENAALRAQLGVTNREDGVMVARVDVDGSCDGLVRARDVLVSIDGHTVSRSGTVDHGGRPLRHYVVLSTKQLGDTSRLGLVRDGAPLEIEVPLRPWLPLVPRARHDVPAEYFIIAGLVFQPLKRDYLTTWEGWTDKAPKSLLDAYYTGCRTRTQHEVVVMTSVLDDAINAGYAPFCNEVVVRVGDTAPLDLAHLVRLVDAATGYVSIELSGGFLLTLEVGEARGATPRILAANQIAADRSPGL